MGVQESFGEVQQWTTEPITPVIPSEILFSMLCTNVTFQMENKYCYSVFSGWNRNSNQAPLKSNQNSLQDVGMSSVSASIFKTARDELVSSHETVFLPAGKTYTLKSLPMSFP